jgi:hypothetical protein
VQAADLRRTPLGPPCAQRGGEIRSTGIHSNSNSIHKIDDPLCPDCEFLIQRARGSAAAGWAAHDVAEVDIEDLLALGEVGDDGVELGAWPAGAVESFRCRLV